MRPSFFVRWVIAACGALVFSALVAAPATASPAAREQDSLSLRAGDSRAAPHRTRGRTVGRASRRTVHYILRTGRLVHRPADSWLQGRHPQPLGETRAAALQSSSSALAAHDPRLLTPLEPLGVLGLTPHPDPAPARLAPRSPRGPPAAAWLG